MEVSIYIKSNFKGNPKGEGKAAAIIEFIDKSGKAHNRENEIKVDEDSKNALILKIHIKVLEMLLKPCKITVYVDCDYIKNIYNNKWLEKWQQNKWKKANGKEPANAKEWKEIYTLVKAHTIYFKNYNYKYDCELSRLLKDKKQRGG